MLLLSSSDGVLDLSTKKNHSGGSPVTLPGYSPAPPLKGWGFLFKKQNELRYSFLFMFCYKGTPLPRLLWAVKNLLYLWEKVIAPFAKAQTKCEIWCVVEI